jgi:DNA mismatch endonuclease (patch repair protein)
MTDCVDKATRSRTMAAIRSKDTKPEKWVRSALHKQGFRFRLHNKKSAEFTRSRVAQTSCGHFH